MIPSLQQSANLANPEGTWTTLRSIARLSMVCRLYDYGYLISRNHYPVFVNPSRCSSPTPIKQVILGEEMVHPSIHYLPFILIYLTIR